VTPHPHKNLVKSNIPIFWRRVMQEPGARIFCVGVVVYKYGYDGRACGMHSGIFWLLVPNPATCALARNRADPGNNTVRRWSSPHDTSLTCNTHTHTVHTVHTYIHGTYIHTYIINTLNTAPALQIETQWPMGGGGGDFENSDFSLWP
jgi:hypothetical protein